MQFLINLYMNMLSSLYLYDITTNDITTRNLNMKKYMPWIAILVHVAAEANNLNYHPDI